MNLTDELHAASAEPPPTRIDLDRLVAREEARKVRARWIAAGCVAAVAVTATTLGVRVAAAPPVEHDLGVVFSPDRVPDLATLPDAAKVWPDAVRALPPRLPDGSDYSVVAALGDDRYLVASGISDPSNSPRVFDTGAGTATPVAAEGAIAGVAEGRVLTTKVAGDQVVWMLEGFRRNTDFRELWTARVDGTGLRRLATLPNGVGPRFALAGDTVLWDVERPGSAAAHKAPFTTVWRVSLAGGQPAELPGSEGWSLAYDGPWLSTQVLREGVEAYGTGELWNPLTGVKRRWTAHSGLQFVECWAAWCLGSGKGLALQNLDGTGYLELPFSGHLTSSREGRLAAGSVRSGGTSLQLVWDRRTGRAAALARYDLDASPGRVTLTRSHNSDYDPPVLSWRTADHTMVLDLNAID
jgi:hypothetical protein